MWPVSKLFELQGSVHEWWFRWKLDRFVSNRPFAVQCLHIIDKIKTKNAFCNYATAQSINGKFMKRLEAGIQKYRLINETIKTIR